MLIIIESKAKKDVKKCSFLFEWYRPKRVLDRKGRGEINRRKNTFYGGGVFAVYHFDTGAAWGAGY